jgi:hypothetical protein
MDEARIRQLTQEVLSQLGSAPVETGDLESRVAALEAAIRELRAARGVTAPATGPVAATAVPVVHVQVQANPSLQVLTLPESGDGRCVVEPDKPCVQSGQCRALGH